jgi:hypothetical protein
MASSELWLKRPALRGLSVFYVDRVSLLGKIWMVFAGGARVISRFHS